MSNNSEYKHTLNLPKTDFPMKADLAIKEPLLLGDWEKKGIYKLISGKTNQKPKYILHDGPPYANGDIHIGHALNKTLKDMIIKYKSLRGFSANYVPGWDCHGLPIEHQLFKELKMRKSQIAQLEFRKKAHAFACKYVATQKEQFKRLGVFGDWENAYLTLSHDYEEAILNSLAELNEKGFLYRGLKPVNWCCKCETALAEAEVEYEEHSSPSIYVKFKLKEAEDFKVESFLVIWTTTPWTLLANVAVAAHPEFIYVYINSEKGNLIVAKDLLSGFLSNAGIDKYTVIRELKGRELDGLIYAHPFVSRNGRVVLADYVSGDEGTGLVHTAPGHGNEDYLTGIKYKLDMLMPVDAKGCFDSTVGEFRGLHIDDANKPILEKLEKLGALLFSSKIQHAYPHCWRCKSALIFRATKQWFLNMEHNDLRNKLQEAISKQVKWVPPGGKERMSAMVSSRPDWCLSRQRYWGVPIPALICNDCKEEFLSTRVIRNFAALSAKTGSDCWFELAVDNLAGDTRCPHCQGKNFSKGADILDVWFDSGVSSQAVLKKRKELEFPASLYLEGTDQHRGWFQSSLISSMCIDNQAPFKSVLTHGFVVDGQGRKMSKSLGNVISPFEIIKDYGADILRMWVASSDYNEEIRISSVILSRLSEAYRKLRNTARFMLSNLYDFDPDTDRVDYKDLKTIDKWILLCLDQSLLAVVENAYEDFEFHKAYKAIYDFCNEKLSMYYLDMVKGRLYTSFASSLERRAAQTAMYEVLNVLVRVMAPILVFTAEEIWQYMPKEAKDKSLSSVHLLDWPENKVGFWKKEGGGIALFMIMVINLVPDIAKALEEKRVAGIIGSSFDARINILTKTRDRYTFLQSLRDELPEIFKVSQVEITFKEDNASELSVKIKKAEGKKCPRCWNYSLEMGSNIEHPLICDNCRKAVGGN